MNHDKHFAFIEFSDVGVTAACCTLDGATMPGRGTLKIRRPNDYEEWRIDKSLKVPTIRKDDMEIIQNHVADGPNKVFVGGLPHHLNDEQVKELLGAFGQIKAFHLIKDTGSSQSKGYCFVEFKVRRWGG